MTSIDGVTHYEVQKFNDATGTWRTVNGTIKVRDYAQSGRTEEQAHALARQEADKQVSGWLSAYPQRQYRTQPVRGRSW